MDTLPVEVMREIYEYDNTYNIKFDNVLKQMMAHFLYTDVVSVKEWDNCYCYCPNCQTYLRFVSKYILPKRVPMKMR